MTNTAFSHSKLIPVLVATLIVLVETIISLNAVFLPDIKSEFGLSPQIAQMTLTIGLFALGFAGIIYGGISESFGRKPIFVFSITLLCISTLIVSISNSFAIFMFARFLQGVGSGAGWVIGNACLKDIYHGKDYTRIMSIIHAVAGITPAFVPILGSYLSVSIGWCHTFIILFFIALVLSLATILFQKETLQKKEPHTVRKILSNYRSIFLNKQFVKYCSVKVLSVSLIFCEIGTLPLVYINHLGVAQENYGYYLLPGFLCYVLTSIMSSHMSKNMLIDNILKIGLGLIIISNILLLLISYYIDAISAIQIQIIKCLTYAGWGFIFGNATAEIVSSVPGKAGNTSAMMIALEMLLSSVIVFLLGFFFNGTIIPLSFCMIIVATFGLLIMHFLKNELVR